MSKTCTHCGISKPRSRFPRNRSMRDGLSSWCSECHTAANREWRRRQPRPPPKPKSPSTPKSLTPAQLELIQLISKGYDTTELAAKLGISREALKSRSRKIKSILGCERMREIPHTYWLKTGLPPFTAGSPSLGSSGFEGREGTSLAQVVDEMFEKGGTDGTT